MYEGFYSFTNTPFSRSIPSASLYKGNDSDELIDRLKYTAQKQLFAVVLGDSGCGKTTTLRRFVDETQNDKCFSLYLSDSKLTPRTFYKNLLEQFEYAKGIPQVPGGYYTSRQVNNAFHKVVTEKKIGPREALTDFTRYINDEITYKRKEFGID